MYKWCNILLACALLGSGSAAKFDNFSVFRVKVENERQLEFLQSLEGNDTHYIFYDAPEHLNSIVDLLVGPHKLDEFKSSVEDYSLDVELTSSNFQA
jgi:Carboxypeptidase activation peptide